MWTNWPIKIVKNKNLTAWFDTSFGFFEWLIETLLGFVKIKTKPKKINGDTNRTKKYFRKTAPIQQFNVEEKVF